MWHAKQRVIREKLWGAPLNSADKTNSSPVFQAQTGAWDASSLSSILHEMDPGTDLWVDVEINSSCTMQAHLFKGDRPGKTLVCTAAVHGCEYNGPEALKRLSERVDARTLSGNLVLVPLMNPSGFFQACKRVVPEDGINLNRAFPPEDPALTLSAQIAEWAVDELYPLADFLIDFHGGDSTERAFTFAYMSAVADPHVNETARRAALSLGLELCVDSTARNGLYSYANQQGIPSLLIENGGQNGWDETRVSADIHLAARLMKHLGIVDDQVSEHITRGLENVSELLSGKSRRITRSVYEESPCQGWWYPCIVEGETFFAGDVLGRIESVTGTVLHEVRAQADGQVLYFTVGLGVCEGEPLVAYGCFEC